MPQGLLIGLGCGLASALLFYSARQGGDLLAQLLLWLTPLPMLLAGLGWGWLPAAAGGLAGALAIAAFDMPPRAGVFLFAIGAPAAIIAYLAYLSRPSPADPEQREWYPLGRLLAALSLYGGALPALALPWTGGSFDELRPAALVITKAVMSQSELRLKPSELQIEAMADMVVAVSPAVMSFYWLLLIMPNLYLAGRIAQASGRFDRDWPNLPAFTYPPGFSWLIALAVLAIMAPRAIGAPGAVGLVGTSLLGALIFAHLLAGLALAHFIAQRGARWLLWVVYASLLLPYSSAIIAVLVALAGLIEPVLKIKQRLGAPPPPN